MRGSATRWIVTAAMVVTVMLGNSSLAYAQAGTSALAGTVKDAQGGVVPGATITVLNPATGATRTAVSGEQGVFNVLGLPPGTYNVKVELSGFKTYVRENVPLRVDSTTQVDAVLTVGALAETVMVLETTPIINSTDASLGNAMTQHADSAAAARSAESRRPAQPPDRCRVSADAAISAAAR